MSATMRRRKGKYRDKANGSYPDDSSDDDDDDDINGST